MSIAKVRWWMWFAVALVIGLLVGSVRQSTADFEDQLDEYGTFVADQRRFEQWLTEKAGDIRQFRDVRVYPYWLPSRKGGKRLVHVVTGYYWNGQATFVNGRAEAHFKPVCHLASVPYTSATAFDASGAGREFPNVLAYLDFLHSTAGVQYRYVWWGWATKPLFVWTVGCVLVIGMAWPAFINLVTFGSLFRPREEKGISLRHVRRDRPGEDRPKPALDPNLAAIEQEVEAHLPDGPSGETVEVPAPTPPRVLPNAPLEPAVPMPAGSEKAFGADKDDFYPTEIHIPVKGKAGPKR